MNESQKVQAIIEILRTGTGAQDAKRDLEGVQSAAGGLNEHLQRLSQTLAATFTAGAVAKFGLDAVKAFADSEAGLNRLNNTLRAAGQFSDEYVRDLREQADALAEVTTADDDAIISSQRLLIQFGAARADMDRLTRAALDLSVGLGTDLNTAATMLGRAVAGETAAFERYGFQIDATADAGTRLTSVVEQVEARFQGLAGGEVGTLLGQTEQLAKLWGDIQKTTGAWLAEAITPAIAELKELIDKAAILKAQAELGSVDVATRAKTASRLDVDLMMLGINDPSRAGEAEKAQAALRSMFNATKSPAGIYAYPRDDRAINAEALLQQDEAVARAMGLLNYTPAGLGGGEQYGPPAPPRTTLSAAAGADRFRKVNTEQFGPTDAEANEQRRKLAREATEELTALEQQLTLESIRAGDYRLGKVNEEYDRRVATYQRLAAEHKITEEQMTSMTRDAAFERDRAVEEGLQRQREQERRAHEERLQEWRQVTAQIEQTIATNVAGGLVNAFRTGKFEADKFFSDLFAQIAQLILQTLILRAIRGMFGAAFAEGGTTFAAAGLPPTFAAEGLTQLNHATYFPRFNVVAGEAGMEMMTVLAKPRPMAFGGVQAMTGFAQGKELAVMSAGGAAALANGSGGGTGRIVIDVNMAPGLRAEITQDAVVGAEVRITQQLGRDSAVRSAVKAVGQ
jgi:hypothetical protein